MGVFRMDRDMTHWSNDKILRYDIEIMIQLILLYHDTLISRVRYLSPGYFLITIFYKIITVITLVISIEVKVKI